MITFLMGFLWFVVVIGLFAFLLYTWCSLFDQHIHWFLRISDAKGLLLDVHRGFFTIGFVDYRL